MKNLKSMLQSLSYGWPMLLNAVSWTTILTITAAAASILPELAFVSSINTNSSTSRGCQSKNGTMFIRVPLDFPGEALCFPARLFRRSKIDGLAPPLFAGVIVAGCACLVRAWSQWEADVEESAAQ